LEAPVVVLRRLLYDAAMVGLARRHGFVVEKEWPKVRLYPLVYHILFGGRQQYMAVLRVPSACKA
jgi:hypothetical protein